MTSLRLLVAEDEALIRLDLVETLSEEGYDVVGEAADGARAVELARELKPDVAVLDIKMPGTDGLEAARQILSERLCAVVMLTAFSQRELVMQARDIGVLSYVVKPFQRGELMPAIELAVARFAEMEALSRQVGALEQQLETRKIIDRAKGILMDEQGLSESDAFKAIQTAAMERRVTMRLVAEELLEAATT